MYRYLDPKNDYAFKRIFGTAHNKDILITLLNEVLKDQFHKPIIDVEFLKPSQDPEILAHKQSIVDVMCRDQDHCRYIIEMQVAHADDFRERAQYYASKAFVSQMRRSQKKYYTLRKVIFLAFTNFHIFSHKKDYKSHHTTRDTKTGEHDLKKLRFTFVDLKRFEQQRKKNNKTVQDLTLEEKFYYFLANAEAISPQERRVLDKEPIIERALDELNRAYWTEEDLLRYEQEEKRVMDNQSILDSAVRLGTAQGIKEGMEKGRTEERATLLQKLVTKGVYPTVTAAKEALGLDK